MVRFLLIFLRPIQRFLAQLISVSTEPSAFVREHIHLGDTTNFFRAANFFLSAISTAFLAEVATLYLLGIGNLTEPYYWLFILLTSIPFVLFSFLLVRFVEPLSFKDVLHLSFYPIGAGVFTGAAFALVASAVIALLVAVGSIPEIKFDFSQWGGEQQLIAVNKRVLYDCLKGESLLFTIVATGLEEAYTNLRPPIDDISYLRPVIAVLYLIIAARVFMAAVDRRKSVVFGTVLLAALIATGANIISVRAYLNWKDERSSCKENLVQAGLDRVAESVLKKMVEDTEKSKPDNDLWDVSLRAERRELIYTFRSKRPIDDIGAFYRWVSLRQKDRLEAYCSNNNWFLRSTKATETDRFYNLNGERLTGFSLGPADCQQW
ncbi:MAG: hypothetical protein WA441_05100 [Methyloceanibacter sp.]